jgi:hypothetical protein
MLATVASFREPWEAHLFRGRLEFEGIPAMVAFENHVGVDWLWSDALGRVRVQVPRSWGSEALEVLSLCNAGIYAKELEAELGDLDDVKCPHCGSQDYTRRRPIVQLVLFLLVLFVLRVYYIPWKWLRRCKVCGTKWERGHLMFLPPHIGEFSEFE